MLGLVRSRWFLVSLAALASAVGLFTDGEVRDLAFYTAGTAGLWAAWEMLEATWRRDDG